MASTQVHPLVSDPHVFELDRVILAYTNESDYFDYDYYFKSWINDTSSYPSNVPSASSSPSSSSSSSSWWWSHYPSGYSWPHIITGASIITVIILMIIFGNFLVIWAIIHDRTLKTTQNLFIASLAFADFFLGLIVIPFSLCNELMGYWLFGVVWCELYKAIDVLLCTASIMSLCLISLDRYWSITRAVHYARQRTRKRAAIMIFTVWFISAVVSIPPLIGWKQPPRVSRWPLCNLSEDIGYVVYSALGSFFIPAFIMVFVYYKIYQAAKQRARKTVKLTACTSENRKEKKHSSESSVSYQGDDKDEPHNVVKLAARREDVDGRGGLSEETACETAAESTAQTTSEDETCSKLPPSVTARALSAERSRLLRRTSDSSGSKCKTFNTLTRDKRSFEVLSSRDAESLDHKQVPVASSPDNVALHGGHNNGSICRFKILELSANGTSSIASENRTKAAKNALLASLRRYIVIRTRNTQKRKHASPCSEAGRAVDFESAERHKRKLAKTRERRATVVLGLVMAAFILCWLPFFSLYLASAFCADYIPEMVFTVFFWIGYCNSALNPIIYTVFNRDFRRAFQKIVFGRRRRHR